MSGLVPYVASELAKPHNAAMAVDLVTEGIKAGASMFKASGKQPKRRTKQRKKTYRDVFKDVGREYNSNPSRRTIREQGVVAIANKELFDEPLIRVEKNVAANETINKRNRDTINYKGTKICFVAKSLLKVPVFLNWAIVTPKAGNQILASDFLRDGSVERDMAVDNQATFLDLRCAPINTDRYRVHTHQKHLILPDSDKDAAVQSEGRDFKIIEKYVPLKRQVFFDGDAATPRTNVYMVYWCDFFNSTVGGLTSDTLDVSWRMIQFYQDIP